MGSVGKTVEGFGQKVGGFLGVNAPTEMGSGGKFAISSQAKAAEDEAIRRLRNQASGKGQSISELQYQQALEDLFKQQQSAVASARGVSNTGLLQRQALQAGQQAGLDLARESAAAKLAEQRGAEQQLLQATAAQRGVALGAAQSQLDAEQKNAANRSQFISNLAGSAAKVATAAFGAEVEHDSPKNDKIPYMLSEGEIVIPKGAAEDRDSAIKFLEAIKFKNEGKKEAKSEDDLKPGMAKLLEEMRKLNKAMSKKEEE